MRNRKDLIDRIIKYAKHENEIHTFICYVKERRADGNHIYCNEDREIITLKEAPSRINICIHDERTEGVKLVKG